VQEAETEAERMEKCYYDYLCDLDNILMIPALLQEGLYMDYL
jgi:hypothetical protein